MTRSYMTCVSSTLGECLPLTETDLLLDDPKLFANQPLCLQVVGRPFQDEEVIAVTEALDLILNP